MKAKVGIPTDILKVAAFFAEEAINGSSGFDRHAALAILRRARIEVSAALHGIESHLMQLIEESTSKDA